MVKMNFVNPKNTLYSAKAEYSKIENYLFIKCLTQK